MTASIIEALENLQGLEGPRHASRTESKLRTVSENSILKEVEARESEDPAKKEKGSRAEDHERLEGVESSRVRAHEPSISFEPGSQRQPKEPPLSDPKLGNLISHSQIIDLSRKLRTHGITSYTLESLLFGSKVYVPPPPPKPEPTSEYKALMARLRAEAESRSYTQMTYSSPYSHFDPCPSSQIPTTSPSHAFTSTSAYLSPSDLGDDENIHSDISKQIALIFNVVVSIVACGAAIWIAARWWSIPARLAVSMTGSLVVGAAEVGVYWGYIRKVAEAKKTERGKKEEKVVIGSWVVGGAKGGGEGVRGRQGKTEGIGKEKDGKLDEEGLRERRKWNEDGNDET